LQYTIGGKNKKINIYLYVGNIWWDYMMKMLMGTFKTPTHLGQSQEAIQRQLQLQDINYNLQLHISTTRRHCNVY